MPLFVAVLTIRVLNAHNFLLFECVFTLINFRTMGYWDLCLFLGMYFMRLISCKITRMLKFVIRNGIRTVEGVNFRDAFIEFHEEEI